jgi:Cu-Zn family superoxide dismutase
MKSCVTLVALLALGSAQAAELEVPVHAAQADGVGAPLGSITIHESEYGLVFTPQLTGLRPGLHGFHLHQNPDCGPADKDGTAVPALAAGGHHDPAGAGRHGTPWGDGHLGDLPPLFVATDGTAEQPVLAPRLRDLEAVAGRALVIHQGGDNHADQPAPLGGGGARVACGVVGG